MYGWCRIEENVRSPEAAITARHSVVLPLPVSPVSSSRLSSRETPFMHFFVRAPVRRAQEQELGIGGDRERLFFQAVERLVDRIGEGLQRVRRLHGGIIRGCLL